MDFYDNIRKFHPHSLQSVFDSRKHKGRNLQLYQPDINDTEISSSLDGHENLLFCHIPQFLEYSDLPPNDLNQSSLVVEPSSCDSAYASSVAAMMAMHHFNTGNGIIVPELRNIHERCNVRFTTEILDTQDPSSHQNDLFSKMITRSSKSMSKPQACAILGTMSSPIQSQVNGYPPGMSFDLFQVTSSSQHTIDAEDRGKYFSRSQTDIFGYGVMSIHYLHKKLGIQNFGILVPNDTFGLAFQKGASKSASKYKMEYAVSRYNPEGCNTNEDHIYDIEDTLQVLKNERYNYIVTAFYTNECVDHIMKVAADMDLVGPGKMWLISGTSDTESYMLEGGQQKPPLSLIGNGVLLSKGGFQEIISGYDQFISEWKSIGSNLETFTYLNSKQPTMQQTNTTCVKNIGNFSQSPPPDHAVISYDAVVGLGLSACMANNSTSESDVFTGMEHRNEFAGLSFNGASGLFTFRPNNPVRSELSSNFAIVNLRQNEINERIIDPLVSFSDSPISYYYSSDYSERKWKIFEENSFIYSDGTPEPPGEIEEIRIVSGDGDIRVRQSDDGNERETIIYATVFSTLVVIVAVIILMLKKRRDAAHLIGTVDKNELYFDDPVKVVGRGTFGLVVQAKYRGTEVAVKRVIPVQESLEFGFASQLILNTKEDSRGTSKTSRMSEYSETSHVRKQPSPRDSDTDYYKEDDDVELGMENFRDSPEKARNSTISTVSSLLSSLCTFQGRSRNSSKQVHDKIKKDFIQEIALLSKLRHPCITTVMGCVFQKGYEPMLIMEYMDLGSLYDILHNMTMPLSGEILHPIMKNIVKGILFLHSATPQIIHGDLKSANVLVDHFFFAKLADFGLSHSHKRKSGVCGTPYWMAPELLRGESSNTVASDTYSFGMVLFEAYSRQNPYEGEDYDSVIEAIMNPSVSKRPTTPAACPSHVKSLMDDCLTDDPQSRPSFDEIDKRLARWTTENIEPVGPNLSWVSKRSHSDMIRTNQLLHDVYPKHIAEALRDGRKVEPDNRDMVTIAFSDIVGFTKISSILSAMEVSDMLDRLYHAFDEISREHDVFKVETIGDAYMVVTNLVEDQEKDHAYRITKFAAAIIEAANKTPIDIKNVKMGNIQIRVGFHSGPVVANIVGSRNPRYCLFGDTVNTASRMESLSSPNCINCSEEAAMLLKTQCSNITLTPRGYVSVKGKGEMKLFWAGGTTPNVTNDFNVIEQKHEGFRTI